MLHDPDKGCLVTDLFGSPLGKIKNQSDAATFQLSSASLARSDGDLLSPIDFYLPWRSRFGAEPRALATGDFDF